MECHRIVRGAAAVVAAVLLSSSYLGAARGADWPLLGRDGTRNAVSPEVGAPLRWSAGTRDRNSGRFVGESPGIRWSAPLGSATYSSPVVSGGLVWIGTNSLPPDAQTQRMHSVLKCFRVADGKQVYEYRSLHLSSRVHDPGWSGLGSSPLVEGDRLWLATNRSEVLCLDIGPLCRGEGPPRELWKLDMFKAFDLFPHFPLMGPPRPCSIGPSFNGRIFVTTNNGVGGDYISVPKPHAPNLVCLNKETGEVLWKDNSPGPNILVSQFASPTVAEIRGQVQVIVPQSDGWVRAFEPMTGQMLWEFDVNAKEVVHILGARGTRNSLLGNAVVYEDRVYLASGQDYEQGEGPGRLVCIDPTKRGDVSSQLAVDANGKPLPRRRVQAVDPRAGEKSIPNPNSALVWEFVQCGTEFQDHMHRSIGSVVIAKGLVIAADFAGIVHCLDAKTGRRHWSHDTMAAVLASPLIVDDQVYVGTEDGEIAIFGLSPDPAVALSKLTGEDVSRQAILMDEPCYSSPIFANGVLFLATRSTLYAIVAAKDQLDRASANPAPEPRVRASRSVFVPTPQDVVDKMLALADVKKSDIVYDLGSGDGRIVITAARQFGCRAIGIEIDKELVESSRVKAEAAGVKSLVTIEPKDLFTADLRDADVIAVFLLPQQLEKLLPQLNTLKPGARIISHQFEFPGYSPDKTLKVESAEGGPAHTIYLWTLPLKKEKR